MGIRNVINTIPLLCFMTGQFHPTEEQLETGHSRSSRSPLTDLIPPDAVNIKPTFLPSL